MNALPNALPLPATPEPPSPVAEASVDALTRKLLQLERLTGELSGELAWTNERLVAEMYDRVAAEANADKLARFDPVTALPNRRALEERVEKELAAHFAGGEPAAIVALGVPRLAEVRAALGLAAGDRVTRIVADRLRRVVRGTDLVARIGESEFALLLTRLSQPDDAAGVARKLFGAIDAPIALDAQLLRLQPVIGMAVFPHDGTTGDLLLARAEAALREAQASGGAMVQHWQSDLAERSARRLTLESELRAALERDEFRVQYQPRFDARKGRLVGAEALLRWQHPQRGLLGPDAFLDVAEDSGLIVPIGERVLVQACEHAAQWNRGGRVLAVSVNLSARQFRGHTLLESLQQILSDARLKPARLQVELAEPALAALIARGEQPALEALRALGVQIALDGFGSAGLAMLRQWPVDCVKIDGEFVRRAVDDRCDALIVAAIAGVGRRLGLRVVASGVETEAQLALVKKHRCHEVQGFLLGEPAPAERVGDWLSAQPAARGRGRSAAPAA